MFTVKTKIKPVIIDFGKANIIVSNHYYKFNTNAIKIQDIVTLIISSSEIITKKQQITSSEISKFIKFFNYLSNTQYTQYKTFTNITDIKSFCISVKIGRAY